MTMSTTQALIVVLLFVLALGGFLHAAWQRGGMNLTRILQHLAFVALVFLDAALLITSTPSVS